MKTASALLAAIGLVALGISSCDRDTCTCAGDTTGTSQPLDSLSLVELIEEIKNDMPGEDSNGYHGPTQEERTEFGSAMSLVIAGEILVADSLLDPFGYDVTLVEEITTGDTLALIQERTPVEHGWGTFVYNQTTDVDVDIHINHPIYDINTYLVGTALYLSARGRWLLMAGTHRYANPGQQSDMARSWSSMFQTVHELVAHSGSVAVSVHGFTPDYYGPPIDTTDIILSNGCTTGEVWRVSQSAVELRALLRDAGWFTGLVVHDSGYYELSGAPNPQGRYSNSIFGHGRWIHVEIARAIREDPERWENVTEIIAGWTRSGEARSRRASNVCN